MFGWYKKFASKIAALQIGQSTLAYDMKLLIPSFFIVGFGIETFMCFTGFCTYINGQCTKRHSSEIYAELLIRVWTDIVLFLKF